MRHGKFVRRAPPSRILLPCPPHPISSNLNPQLGKACPFTKKYPEATIRSTQHRNACVSETTSLLCTPKLGPQRNKDALRLIARRDPPTRVSVILLPPVLLSPTPKLATWHVVSALHVSPPLSLPLSAVHRPRFCGGGTRPVLQSGTLFPTQRSHGPRRNLCMVARVVLQRRSRPGISAKIFAVGEKLLNTGGVKLGRLDVREKVGTLFTTHSLTFLVHLV